MLRKTIYCEGSLHWNYIVELSLNKIGETKLFHLQARKGVRQALIAENSFSCNLRFEKMGRQWWAKLYAQKVVLANGF